MIVLDDPSQHGYVFIILQSSFRDTLSAMCPVPLLHCQLTLWISALGISFHYKPLDRAFGTILFTPTRDVIFEHILGSFWLCIAKTCCWYSYSAWWVSDFWYILIYLIQFSVALVYSHKAITRMVVSNWFLRLLAHSRPHILSLSFQALSSEALSSEAVISLYIPT